MQLAGDMPALQSADFSAELAPQINVVNSGHHLAGKPLQKTKVCFPRNTAPGPEEVEPAGEFFSKTDRNGKQRFQWSQIKECLIQPDLTRSEERRVGKECRILVET